MADLPMPCSICRGPALDAELGRVQVWEDALWRVTTRVAGVLPGFSYLEPKRHIPYVSDLDGEEARTFGGVLARVSGALRAATGAPLVYVYIFGGGVPHLHVHLAPHREGDALNDQLIRGELIERKLPSGFTAFVSVQFPPLPEAELRAVAGRLRGVLAAT